MTRLQTDETLRWSHFARVSQPMKIIVPERTEERRLASAIFPPFSVCLQSSIGLPTRLRPKCLPERFLAQFTPSSTCNLTSLSINRLTPEILQWTFLTSFPHLTHLAMPYRAKIDIDLSLIARYAPTLQSLDTTLHLDTNSLVCSYIVSQGSIYQLPRLSYLRPYWTSKASLAPILKWASSGRVEYLQLNWPFHSHEVHRVSRRECLSLLEEKFWSLQTLDLCLVRHDEVRLGCDNFSVLSSCSKNSDAAQRLHFEVKTQGCT